jgi:hypothetical protein
VHDGIHSEKEGIPSATICTDRFVQTAGAMAKLWGAADYPTIFTEHPISNLDRPALRARAEKLAPIIISVLTTGS